MLTPMPTREMPALLPRDVEVDEPAPAGRSKLLLIGGLAAVLIVGGVVAKVMTSKPAPVSAAPASTVPARSEVPTPVATKPAALPVEAPAATRPVRVDADPRPAKTKGKATDDAAPAPAPRAAESDGPHGGFTGDQLKAILDKADKLTANGKYEEAIRNYNVVLSADPGNGRAKMGKERAVTNMNMP